MKMGPGPDLRKELSFPEKLLLNMNLHTFRYNPGDGEFPEADLGLRKQLGAGTAAMDSLKTAADSLEDNTLCCYEDEFACSYFLLRLPGCGDKDKKSVNNAPRGTILVIGPYITGRASDAFLEKLIPDIGEDFAAKAIFRKYYSLLPVITEGHLLYTVVYTLAEHIWGSMSSFAVIRMHSNIPGQRPVYPVQLGEHYSLQEIDLRNRALEEAYYWENEIMYAVTHGKINLIETMLNNIPIGLEQRLSDKVRNLQNYTVIFNTLLRKAAESGHVPLPHIDSISSGFALRIENCGSVRELYALQKEMARKYCLLVNNYSMQGYSPVIRRVLTAIDEGLAADLSLSALSRQLNINASYLSSLFKKELKISLTDYVNQKRVLQGAYLLSMTSLPVQEVSARCGITDVNYFARIFKRQMGQTPTDYRKSLGINSLSGRA